MEKNVITSNGLSQKRSKEKKRKKMDLIISSFVDENKHIYTKAD